MTRINSDHSSREADIGIREEQSSVPECHIPLTTTHDLKPHSGVLHKRAVGIAAASSLALRRPLKALSNFSLPFSRNWKKNAVAPSKSPASPTLPELPKFSKLPGFELIAALAKESLQGTPVTLAASGFAKKVEMERKAELKAISQQGLQKANAKIQDRGIEMLNALVS